MFVYDRRASSFTQKGFELQEAQLKSHAANFAHRRRRQRQKLARFSSRRMCDDTIQLPNNGDNFCQQSRLTSDDNDHDGYRTWHELDSPASDFASITHRPSQFGAVSDPHLRTALARSLETYLHITEPTIGRFFKILNVFDIYQGVVIGLLQNLHSEIAIKAWLAYTAAARAKAVGSPQSDVDMLQGYGSALVALRERLTTMLFTESFDEQFIISLMLILNTTLIHGDLQSAAIHWSTLLHAIKAMRRRGKTLSPLCCSQIRIWQKCISPVYRQQPLLKSDSPSYQESAISPVIELEYHVRLPRGFRQLILQNRLSDSTIETLHRVNAYVNQTSLPEAYRRRQPSSDFDHVCPAPSNTPGFDHLLQSALILFTMKLCYPNSHGSYIFGAIHRRKEELTKSLSNFETECFVEWKAVLWMWLLLLATQSIGKRGVQPLGHKMLKDFQAQHPHLANAQNVRLLSRDFFRVDSLLAELESVLPAVADGGGHSCDDAENGDWWPRLEHRDYQRWGETV